MLNLDDALLNAVLTGTVEGLAMTEVVPVAVGASCYSGSAHNVTVIVGLVGQCSGTMAMSLSNRSLLYLAGKLLGETLEEINEGSVDAMMELGNMVAGCVKDHLVESEYKLRSVSLPSLIIGPRHDVIYGRGIASVSVQFELGSMWVLNHADRFFTATASLQRRSK